jgi:hypothetical protein
MKFDLTMPPLTHLPPSALTEIIKNGCFAREVIAEAERRNTLA